ncbi:MAG: S9 family peptidase, partial [Planctomycetaceae bacterium]|nr:S9 family peptidase [Planctomycetaceae bacterium]
RTDVEAPRKRVIAIDLRQPGREHWREIIPQSDDTLTGVSLIGGQFVARYLRDARSEVRTFRLDGTPLRTVDLPGIGTAGGFSGRQTQTETFYSFSSFATPPEIYRYDLLTGESQRIRRAEVAFNPDDYEVKQEFYTSRDGTRVPMFIAHRRGLKLDGNNPTLLYGYGGFN